MAIFVTLSLKFSNTARNKQKFTEKGPTAALIFSSKPKPGGIQFTGTLLSSVKGQGLIFLSHKILKKQACLAKILNRGKIKNI